jgi:hypothetical protein
MAGTAAPHTLQMMRLYLPYRACCTSWVRSPTKPLRCVLGNSPTGNRITGRLLAAEHSSEALPPFRDSLGSHCPLRVS